MNDTPTKQKKPRILIVDDEPANLKVLGEPLKGEYTVIFAFSGEDALNMAQSDSPPDLILLDIVMPEMDGLEVCRQLKADDSTKDIPVIFVTSKNSEKDEEEGLLAGAVDYIAKPCSPAILKARVKNHLELKRNRDLLTELLRSSEEEYLKLFEKYNVIVDR